MATVFWEAQKKAQEKTLLYGIFFVVLTLMAAFCAEIAMRAFAGDSYGEPPIPYVGIAFLCITFIVAGFNYLRYLQSGGRVVAESMGGRLINKTTANPAERQLLNIIEELSLASSLPIPPVYVIPAQEINAFAAGTSPENAAIGVTIGTLKRLNRDELQGVLAHEFGHIYHRDMKVGMRVAAMIMGFFIVSYVGLRLLTSSSYGFNNRKSDSDDQKDSNPMMMIALIFLAIGAVTWFFGSILQATVSRQRELLADATSVQFTRNPEGLVGALKKIAQMNVSDMPKSGQAFSHLYFNEHPSFWARLFATHPPIEERIAAIQSGKDD